MVLCLSGSFFFLLLLFFFRNLTNYMEIPNNLSPKSVSVVMPFDNLSRLWPMQGV